MNQTLLSLFAGLVSGAITAVVTYFATLAKARLDLTIEHDKALLQSRLEVYRDLWKRLKPLARYSPERPITYQIAKDTSEKLRDWYFDVGGIYLSRESRDPYFALKQALQNIIDKKELQQSGEVSLDPIWIRPLHERGKALREVLSNDIGTRRQSFM